ncbi:VOC family protein [Aureimonas populi]|uniref:VOC family protein n=1 Tax=Aureimonas populi TaxID=1701758 RepID=A0ABW5CS99_9HYPH|nr:VOC family protein [Aureimonas populi]
MKMDLHHVNICGTDVPRLRAFYSRVFGLAEAATSSGDQIASHGYDEDVAFLSDGKVEFHLAKRDLGVSYRTKQPVNPLDRGHIAFRTDDIEAFKKRLTEEGVPFADYGEWAIKGWYQIFFQDPEGTIIEVHQADYVAPEAR